VKFARCFYNLSFPASVSAGLEKLPIVSHERSNRYKDTCCRTIAMSITHSDLTIFSQSTRLNDNLVIRLSTIDKSKYTKKPTGIQWPHQHQ